MNISTHLKIHVLACSLSLLPFYAKAEETEKDQLAATNKTTEDLPLKELRTFAEVLSRVKQEFVEPVTDKELIHHAIRGMIDGLDPHSSFLTADEYKDLQVGTSGEFGGLGIEVGMENGFIKVISPIDDTPAQKAGIKSGDIIIRLNKTAIKDMSLDEAVNLMRGAPGSQVTLTITRDGIDKPIIVTLERAIIHVVSVKSRMLEPGFGYLRISQFQIRTNEDMLKEIERLKTESKGSLKGVILDLRNNPGGILNAAVTVSDAFLEGGLIVYTEGRNAESKLEFKAGPDDVLIGAPIVILINGGSASAAEIVAGALQDHKRALVVGEQSFGKGSVQSVIQIDQESALKLTTARYYTPLGRSIQAEGITPDILINQIKVNIGENVTTKSIKEADLARHLVQNNNTDNVTNDKEQPEDKNGSPEELIEKDFQLSSALNLLKGLSLMRPVALQHANPTVVVQPTTPAPTIKN